MLPTMEARLHLEVTESLSREIGKVFVGQSIQQLNSSPDWGSYSKVILRTGDGEGYEAGDDSGLTLEADCPYANQAIADAVLASLQGESYKPYDGSGAYITPAAEIGDGMSSDGFYSGIYSLSRKFSKISAADIAAPTDTEVQHEFQYVTQSDRRFTRKMKEISAEFAVMADEISAKVSQTGGDNSSFGWSMKVDGMKWYADGSQVMKVDKNGLEVTGTIKGGSVLTGNLYIGGTSIDDKIAASTLRSGAQWPTSSYGETGYTNGGWSLTGGGYGFNFNNATTWNTNVYPNYFKSDYINAVSTLVFQGNACTWQDKTLPDGTSYTFLVKET